MAFTQVGGEVEFLSYDDYDTGDVLVEGKYLGFYPAGKFDSGYYLVLEGKKRIALWAKGALDKAFEIIPKGSVVRVVANGWKRMKSGRYAGKDFRDFEVFVDDDSVQGELGTGAGRRKASDDEVENRFDSRVEERVTSSRNSARAHDEDEGLRSRNSAQEEERSPRRGYDANRSSRREPPVSSSRDSNPPRREPPARNEVMGHRNRESRDDLMPPPAGNRDRGTRRDPPVRSSRERSVETYDDQY